jgi:sugar phosphate isomerase/epimerase
MPAPALSRRDLLRAAALAGVAGPRLARAADAPARKPMRIAVQMYSVRGDCEKDFDAALAAVAKLGFEGVEFAGYHGYQDRPAALKARLADLNLAVAGTHVRTPKLRGDELRRTIEFHQELGCSFLIVPGDGDFTHAEKSTVLADTFNAAAEQLKPLGMACGYHNHTKELQKGDDGKTWWDLFAERTGPDVILQQDVGWTVTAGLDPVEFIKKYPGRTRTTHFKPAALTPDRRPILGQDTVDWPAVITACRDVGGTEWMTIEQETYEKGRSPMECTALSLAGLKKILADLKPA